MQINQQYSGEIPLEDFTQTIQLLREYTKARYRLSVFRFRVQRDLRKKLNYLTRSLDSVILFDFTYVAKADVVPLFEKIKSCLLSFSEVFAILEDSNFFDGKKLKKSATCLLTKLFEAECKLRYSVYSDEDTLSDEAELAKFNSAASIKLLQSQNEI